MAFAATTRPRQPHPPRSLAPPSLPTFTGADFNETFTAFPSFPGIAHSLRHVFCLHYAHHVTGGKYKWCVWGVWGGNRR
jgi:hypothetical protein